MSLGEIKADADSEPVGKGRELRIRIPPMLRFALRAIESSSSVRTSTRMSSETRGYLRWFRHKAASSIVAAFIEVAPHIQSGLGCRSRPVYQWVPVALLCG